MQKIFTRYISTVVIVALLAILGLNWVLQEQNSRMQMVENSRLKLEQISRTLENNEVELRNLKESLSEDYLTRAYAFAYIIQQNPDVLNSQEELERIAALLNVDELHVIDEKGILFAGSIPKYFGMDFHTTDQTKEFLRILDDPDSYLVQDIRPNGYEQKIFQYIGVARQDKKGIVQVGMAPTRMLDAQKRNQLDYILSRIPVDSSSILFAVDLGEGSATVRSDDGLQEMTLEELGLSGEDLTSFSEGKAAVTAQDQKMYYVIRSYGGQLLGVGMTGKALYAGRNRQILLTSVYLILTSMVMIWVLNRLLKHQIVDGIHTIVGNLSDITEGNLNTVVKVENNPEFRQLSTGINKMVKGILNATVKVSKVIDMVDMPIGVFEFGHEGGEVMATDRLRMVLNWSESKAREYYRDRKEFGEALGQLMRHPEEGETDIYKLAGEEDKWVRIQMTSDESGTFGVATDVTRDMIEKRKIQHERDYDSLTGLRKIDAFRREVTDILGAGDPKSCAMVMLDLDNFKSINDAYGHDWGDEYLRYCSGFLKKMNGDQGITARRSGDEFCLFLHHFKSRAEIANRMEEFFGKLEREKIKFPDGSVQKLRISAGLAWYGDGLNSYGTLLKASDYALYDSKNSGKGIWKQYSLE